MKRHVTRFLSLSLVMFLLLGSGAAFAANPGDVYLDWNTLVSSRFNVLSGVSGTADPVNGPAYIMTPGENAEISLWLRGQDCMIVVRQYAPNGSGTQFSLRSYEWHTLYVEKEYRYEFVVFNSYMEDFRYEFLLNVDEVFPSDPGNLYLDWNTLVSTGFNVLAGVSGTMDIDNGPAYITTPADDAEISLWLRGPDCMVVVKEFRPGGDENQFWLGSYEWHTLFVEKDCRYEFMVFNTYTDDFPYEFILSVDRIFN